MSAKPKSVYRPSASIIIAAKTELPAELYDYRLLLFKRSAHTAYAADHCVFPGGVFEATADESPAWLQHFKTFGIPHEQLEQLVHVKGTTERPHPLLTSGRNFSRDISLRITAIRETFEEVGVLLCRDRNSLTSTRRSGHYCENFDRAHWQRAVHEDPAQFLILCQELQVVPDLWSLHEWSVWRSPTTASKKYDTVFYLVALEQRPNLLLERTEVELEFWRTPAKFLRSFGQRSIWLPPIQFYELSRLTHAHNWTQLLQFACSRSSKGSTMLMPVYYRCDEGLVGILPGDDFYPADPNAYGETIVVPSSMRVFRKRAQRLHRLVLLDMHDVMVELTIPPVDAHLSPLKETPIRNKL